MNLGLDPKDPFKMKIITTDTTYPTQIVKKSKQTRVSSTVAIAWTQNAKVPMSGFLILEFL